MYSFDTEFLTRRGWLAVDDIKHTDELAFHEGDVGISWSSKEECNLTHYDFKIPLLELHLGRSGKFCISSDLPMRLFRNVKGNISFEEKSLLDLIIFLEKREWLPGYILGSIKKKQDTSAGYLQAAGFLAAVFKGLYSVSEEGVLTFFLSRAASKESIVKELLKLGVEPNELSMGKDRQLEFTRYSYEDLVMSVISTPKYLLASLMQMIELEEYNKKSIRSLRFYDKRLGDLAQLAFCLSGYNSKLVETDTKVRPWLLVIDPSQRSICFRNRTIVLSVECESVTLSKPHPLTRYDGRTGIL